MMVDVDASDSIQPPWPLIGAIGVLLIITAYLAWQHVGEVARRNWINSRDERVNWAPFVENASERARPWLREIMHAIAMDVGVDKSALSLSDRFENELKLPEKYGSEDGFYHLEAALARLSTSFSGVPAPRGSLKEYLANVAQAIDRNEGNPRA